MTNKYLLITAGAIVCFFSVLHAQTEQPKPNGNVRIKTFYLRNGRLIMGRAILEDKNQITIEELNLSPIAVSMYARKQIASGTMHTQVMSELDYCLKFAPHFAAKAWDFKNDPDDFIQAIRLYEKAKQLLSQAPEPDPHQISEIDQKIAMVKADRQIWITEAKSRAELSKLQTQALIDQRMDELKQEITNNTAEVAAIRQTLDDQYKDLERRISDFDKIFEDLYRTLQQLADDIDANTADIRELRRYYRQQPTRIYIQPNKQPR